MAAEEFEYSERGFARWPEIETTYGHQISVYESSAATGPHIWLGVRGSCHLQETPKPFVGVPGGIADGSCNAHMTVEQAEHLYAQLGAIIDFSRKRWVDEPEEDD